MTSRTAHPRSDRASAWPPPRPGSQQLWSERIWPVLAGTVTFLATIGLWSAFGPAGLVVAPLGTYLFVAVLLYGTVSETSLTLAWSLRTALVVTIVLMDVTGLLLLWPVAGGVVAGVVGLCSPPVTGLLARSGRRTRPPVDPPVLPELDQAEVDRIFADIVSGF